MNSVISWEYNIKGTFFIPAKGLSRLSDREIVYTQLQEKCSVYENFRIDAYGNMVAIFLVFSLKIATNIVKGNRSTFEFPSRVTFSGPSLYCT